MSEKKPYCGCADTGDKILTLGVDTSNYTTSLALVRGGTVIKNVRRLLPVGENERGLRQSDALFHHTKALPELCEELFSCGNYEPEKLCAVGVSSKPRNTENSYMPCFLAGISFASAVSGALKAPLFNFSHQQGHIEAAIYSSGIQKALSLSNEFISFHVSGGTTDIVLCSKKADGSIACEKIGGTTDLNAGQAIDRTGVMLGLRFPCGKELDEMSCSSSARFGKIKVSVEGLSCSVSGLENKTKTMAAQGVPPCDIAAFLFEYLSCVLGALTDNLKEKYSLLPVLFAGGVMSNTRIRKNLSKRANVFFASPELSSDNACGTSLLAYNKFKAENM